MSDAAPGAVTLDADGAAAPPRSNGELVFASPWESRLFGVTMALVESGTIDWPDFRRRLIAQIGAWDAAHRDDPAEYAYYEHWQAALEAALHAKNLCTGDELAQRARALSERPAGHDHG